MSRWMWGLVALTLMGCGSDKDGDEASVGGLDSGPTSATAQPELLLEPTSLSFGTLEAGEVEIQELVVTNTGEAPLTVSSLAVGTADYQVSTSTPVVIDPDDSAGIQVRFSPLGDGVREDQLTVISDDPDQPTATVAITGEGEVPVLTITPSTIDFADAAVPCEATQQLELSNTGSADLIIESAAVSGDPVLTLAGGPSLPLTLAPGEVATATVAYTPEEVGDMASADLTVFSSDPTGDVVVPMMGNGDYADLVSTNVSLQVTTDVLIALDTSCSMEDTQADKVAVGFPSLIDALDGSDWRVLLVNDNDGCSPGVLTPASPDPAQLLIDRAFDANSLFNDLSEQLLTLTNLALDKSAPGECNEGFFRPDADLHVVMISDEDEQTPNATVPSLVSEIESHLSPSQKLTMSAVVDPTGACVTFGDPGDRYVEAADLTGGGVLDIPNRHAVGGHPQFVVVWRNADPPDDALFLQPLDPAPAWRLAHSGFFCNFRNRQRCIPLQDSENTYVRRVEKIFICHWIF